MVKFSGKRVIYALSISDPRANATFLDLIPMLSSLLKVSSTVIKLLNIILSVLVFPLRIIILSPK